MSSKGNRQNRILACGSPWISALGIDASLGLTVCALVAAGCGVGIVDSETARMQQYFGVVSKRFRRASRVPIYMFRQRGRPMRKLADEFGAALKPPPAFRTRA